MRKDTVTTKVYTFGELNDDAKEKAREWWRSGAFDYEWWDCVYEDATTLAALFGLDIDKIYFSGFWSQGDGACFEGSYEYKKGGLKAVMEHAPQDKKLHAIVKQLQDIQRPTFYRLTATTKQSGLYNHSGCMSVDVSNDDTRRYYSDATNEQEEELTDELRCFADWIYSQLETEYEWINADEQVDEAIRSNEYEFTEEGNIY